MQIAVSYFNWKYQDWRCNISNKTTLSEANVETNWAYHELAYREERSFASNCFIFSKILVHFRNLI